MTKWIKILYLKGCNIPIAVSYIVSVPWNQDEEGVEKMLNMSYMMGVCAEGELKYAEDVCQHVFTFEKLVR